MKILEYVTVKGRGVLALVDAVPPDLREGMYVTKVLVPAETLGFNHFGSLQSTRRWKVSGIETHALPRTRARVGGVLLHGDEPLPDVGAELEICSAPLISGSPETLP
jgi:hypothetical protein